MRKHGRAIVFALLLLLVPVLANAWTLYVKVSGSSSDGTVIIKDVVGNNVATLKGGQTSVQLPDGAATATVNLEADKAADVTIDYDTVQQTVASANYPLQQGTGSLIVAWGQATSKMGDVTISKEAGGTTLVQYKGQSTMTGFNNLAYGETFGVKASPRSDYKVTSITVTATNGFGTQVDFATSNAGEAKIIGYKVDGNPIVVSATYAPVATFKLMLSAPLKAVAGSDVALNAAGTSSNMEITNYKFMVDGVQIYSGPNPFATYTPAVGDAGTTKTVSLVVTAGTGTDAVNSAPKTASINVVSEAVAYNNLCLGCHTGSTPAVIEAYNDGTHGTMTTTDVGVACQKCHNGGSDEYTHSITQNTVGRDVAAGSDVCLRCHTDKSDWASTPHTQKAQMGYENVIGYNADPDLYTEAAKWITDNRYTYVHPKNKDANGDVIDDTKLGVRAVMTEKPITYSDQTFGVEDITIVIGSNHKQAYAVWMEGYGNKILNIRYNGLDPGLTRSMGDRTDERVWEGSCIGCHSTTSDAIADLPLNYTNVDNDPATTTPFDLNPYLVDLRVGCEACHGPSGMGLHNGHTINPADLTQDQQIDICGRCHGNWNTTVPGTSARKDVPEFKAGDSLVYLLSPEYNGGVDRVRRPSWNANDTATKPFLGNGASNDDHQQWYDIKIGNHYGKFFGGKPVTCTSCHDPHKKSTEAGRIYGRLILKGSYDLTNGTSTICATCHEGASFVVDGKTVTKKGKTGAINPHTAKPYGKGVDLDPNTDGDQLPTAGSPWPWE